MDTPDKDELIAANNDLEKIREYTEADSLAYLSKESLEKAVDDVDANYCYSCYTGRYPTDIVGIEQLIADHREKG